MVKYSLGTCKGCGAVGLVEPNEPPLCGRCEPDAFSILLAEKTIERARRTPPAERGKP